MGNHFSLFAGVAAALAVAAPAGAQSFSEGYTFIKAVKDRDGNKVNEMAGSDRGPIVVNTKDAGNGDTALHIVTRGRDGAIGTPTHAEGYWVVDAVASYAFRNGLELRLNLYNLFDEHYVAAINKSGYRYTPGTPRSAMLTASYRF